MDGLLLIAAGLVCVLAFVARIMRRDRVAGRTTDPDGLDWLLVGTAVLAISAGVAVTVHAAWSAFSR